jgi:hypothetical protein
VATRSSANGKTRPTRKKPQEKSGTKGIVFGILGCGAIVLLLGCSGGLFGITGYVWPGFMVKKTDGHLAAKGGGDKEGDKGGGKGGEKTPLKKDPPLKENDPPGKVTIYFPPRLNSPSIFDKGFLAPGAAHEWAIQLRQGQNIRIIIGRADRKGGENIDFYLFRGEGRDAKDVLAFNERPNNQPRATSYYVVEYSAPAADTYYFRIVNRGAVQANSLTMQVEEVPGK